VEVSVTLLKGVEYERSRGKGQLRVIIASKRSSSQVKVKEKSNRGGIVAEGVLDFEVDRRSAGL